VKEYLTRLGLYNRWVTTKRHMLIFKADIMA